MVFWKFYQLVQIPSSEPPWQQSKSSDFLVESLKLRKKAWVIGRSSGHLPLACLHIIIQVQTRAINTGRITSLANTLKLSESQNNATRAINVNVKGQGQESNFLFQKFRTAVIQSNISQISWLFVFGGFFQVESLIFFKIWKQWTAQESANKYLSN